MAVVRAKFRVDQVIRNSWDNGAGATVKLQAIMDDGTPENQRFSAATPSGSLEMHVNNPGAVEILAQLGAQFYLDFTPVES